MQIDAERRITRFVEKPKDPALLDSLKLPPEWYAPLGIKGEGELFLASMGIYVFNRDIIRRLLDNTLTDFGKHVIPNAIQGPARVLLRVPGLLGGHRDHPRLLRGQPRRDQRVAALQLLRHGRADLQPARASCPARKSTAPRSIMR